MALVNKRTVLKASLINLANRSTRIPDEFDLAALEASLERMRELFSKYGDVHMEPIGPQNFQGSQSPSSQGQSQGEFSGKIVSRVSVPQFSGNRLEWPSVRVFLLVVSNNPKVPGVQMMSKSVSKASSKSSCHLSESNQQKANKRVNVARKMSHRAKYCFAIEKHYLLDIKRMYESTNFCVYCFSHKLVECGSTRNCFKCGLQFHTLLNIDSEERKDPSVSRKSESTEKALESSSNSSSSSTALNGVKIFCVQHTSLGLVLSGQYSADSCFIPSRIFCQSNLPLNQLFRSFWEIEELQPDHQSLLSVDELACDKFHQETHSCTSAGHQMVQLSFKMLQGSKELDSFLDELISGSENVSSDIASIREVKVQWCMRFITRIKSAISELCQSSAQPVQGLRNKNQNLHHEGLRKCMSKQQRDLSVVAFLTAVELKNTLRVRVVQRFVFGNEFQKLQSITSFRRSGKLRKLNPKYNQLYGVIIGDRLSNVQIFRRIWRIDQIGSTKATILRLVSWLTCKRILYHRHRSTSSGDIIRCPDRFTSFSGFHSCDQASWILDVVM